MVLVMAEIASPPKFGSAWPESPRQHPYPVNTMLIPIGLPADHLQYLSDQGQVRQRGGAMASPKLTSRSVLSSPDMPGGVVDPPAGDEKREAPTPAASSTPIPDTNKRHRQHSTHKTLRFTELQPSNAWSDPDSLPQTPNLSESLTSIRRTLSLSALSTLPHTLSTSLTPHPLSTHPSQIFDPEILRSALGTVAGSAKSVVWRAKDERRPHPSDAERALVLSIRRATRSGILAYLLRSGINLLLLLLRGARSPRRFYTKKAFLKAVLGGEAFRFAGMIGVFTGLNTLVGNLLRLGTLAVLRKGSWEGMRRILRRGVSHRVGTNTNERRPQKGTMDQTERGHGLGISLKPTSPSPSPISHSSDFDNLNDPSNLTGNKDRDQFQQDQDQSPYDTGERKYHAALAGAIASLGLLCEAKGRRVGVGQQLFVRGLQATYNTLSLTHPSLTLPFSLGPILTFGLCSGQIMFAFLLSPETIPKEYNDWILAASGVKKSAIVVNRGLERGRKVVVEGVEAALGVKSITPHNRRQLLDLLEKGKQGIIPDGVPCAAIHPWLDSCRAVQIERYFTTVRFMLPVYSALHFIPMLVLRSSHVRRDPFGMLSKAAWGTLRSSSFLAGFVMIYQGLLCFRTQLLEGYLGEIPQLLRRLLKRKQSFWMIGFMTCFSLFVEEKRRRAELAMYVLPKALESAWSSARKRAWVPLVPFGENLLGAAAMAMVMHAYKHEPDALSGLVRKVMYQMIGPA